LLDGVDDAAAIAPLLTYFLDRGVDPAVLNDSGLTPLHNAAGYGAGR
jgi:ankyrin repeat protein